MPFPITVTPKAIDQLKRLVAKDGREGAFLRVGVKGGGCSGMEYVMRIDVDRKPIDQSQMFDGIEVVCDAKSARFLDGSTLDYTGTWVM